MQKNLAASPQQPTQFSNKSTPRNGVKAAAARLPNSSPPAPLGIARREESALGNFPGATGPGSGARHFPELEASRRQEMIDGRRERAERFEMKSGGEMYRDFPGMVRASTPLYIKSAGAQEPLGKVEQEQKDAGPTTGHRRMPEPVDSQGRQRPRLPSHPDTSKAELLRERDSRQL